MKRIAYPTDLKSAEWEIIKSILSKYEQCQNHHPGGRPPSHTKKDYFDALLYLLRTGFAWRQLPHDFPKWQSIYTQFRRWHKGGFFKILHDNLHKKLRLLKGRSLYPSAAIVDSQSVKTTDKGGAKGYDGGKKSRGVKGIY